MGRSPCCDKIGLKKGPWTPEEDQKLLAYIEEHGHGSWRALPGKAGLQRCGKSCRLRWTNYLRPDIKRGKFSLQEEQTIIQLHALLGNRWSAIATHLPKRTDNEIKNYWNTHLKKRLAKMGIDPVTHKPKNDALLSNDGPSKNAANLSHMAQWESARLEAEARLARQSKLRSTSANSFLQGQSSSEFASTSTSTHQTLGPARCIDVLKAWNGGIWARNNDELGASGGVSLAGIGGDLESPTSTLSSAVGIGDGPTPFIELVRNSTGSSVDGGIWKEGGESKLKNPPEYSDGITNSMPFPTALPEASIPADWAAAEGNSSEHVPCGNFVEKFTDLLLSTSSGDRRFSEDGAESDNGRESGAAGDDDYFEDNKNYWNSILNLVDSSPSDSPMF